jgi:hypothetical protein
MLDASVMVKFAGGSIDSRALTIFSVLKLKTNIPYSFPDSSMRRIFIANKDVVFSIRTIAWRLPIRSISSSGHGERIHPCLLSVRVLMMCVVVNAFGQSFADSTEGGRRDDATTWQGQLILFPKGAGVLGLSDIPSPSRGSSGHQSGSSSPQRFSRQEGCQHHHKHVRGLVICWRLVSKVFPSS